ncbi:small ribosomal subunit protein bS16m [Petromyzon marinus]|uniref:small ribosomal subunit protein bS16m n=1 Tax=Petromyzon marinus TaxID=7757 RepID=UPI003F7135CE
MNIHRRHSPLLHPPAVVIEDSARARRGLLRLSARARLAPGSVQREERDTRKKVTMVHLGLALSRRYVSGHIVIRMALGGCTNRPVYNIVTMFNKRARDAPYLEQVGTYDPMPNAWGQRLVGVNLERISYWLASGAQLSTPVAKLLGLSGFLPLHPMTITAAERKQRQHEKQQRAEAEASRVEKAES